MKSEKQKFNSIRFFTDLPDSEYEEAVRIKKRAEATNVLGAGSWKIESFGGNISYLFFPGTATNKLAPMKTKTVERWTHIGHKATKMWKKKIPEHEFSFALDQAEAPKGFIARLRRKKQEAYMLASFKASKEKLAEAAKKAKKLAADAQKV